MVWIQGKVDTDWIQVHLRSVCIQELVHRCVVLIQVHFGSMWIQVLVHGCVVWIQGKLDTVLIQVHLGSVWIQVLVKGVCSGCRARGVCTYSYSTVCS